MILLMEWENKHETEMKRSKQKCMVEEIYDTNGMI